MVEALAISAYALFVIGALTVALIAGRRVLLARSARRRAAAEARLRPLVLALTAGDPVDLPSRSAHDSEVLAGLLGRYSRSLTGTSREHITAVFEGRGDVERQARILARDRRPWRRATAAQLLGGMGSQLAVPALLEGLGDRQRDVRISCTRALGALGAEAAVEPVVEALAARRVPSAVTGAALLAIGPAALPHLHALARQPDAAVRASAVELTGLLGDAVDGDALVASLDDSAAEVRARAAHALGRLGARTAAAALRERLDDRMPFVRTQAAHALGKIGDRDALDKLISRARTDAFAPAQAAAAAAARIDPRALAAAAGDEGAGPHLHEANDLLAVAP